MIFAQEAADDQEAVARIDVGDWHAQPRCAGLHAIGRKVRLSQTEIDVVAAQPAHQFLQQVQLFQRAVRCGQRRNLFCTVCRLDLAQTIRHILKGCLPIDFYPLAVLLEHRPGQTLSRVQPFITESVLIGNPAFVDSFVLDRYNAQHFIVLHLHRQIGTQAIVRTDRLALRQLPVACSVTERLAGQRAYRTQIDHVAGQLRIHRAVHKAHDFGMLATERHTQFHHPGDLLPKTHTARALDAAVHLFGGDQRTNILGHHAALGFLITRCAAAVSHSQIL